MESCGEGMLSSLLPSGIEVKAIPVSVNQGKGTTVGWGWGLLLAGEGSEILTLIGLLALATKVDSGAAWGTSHWQVDQIRAPRPTQGVGQGRWTFLPVSILAQPGVAAREPETRSPAQVLAGGFPAAAPASPLPRPGAARRGATAV